MREGLTSCRCSDVFHTVIKTFGAEKFEGDQNCDRGKQRCVGYVTTTLIQHAASGCNYEVVM